MPRPAPKTKRSASPPSRRASSRSAPSTEVAKSEPKPELAPGEAASFKEWDGRLNPTERIVDEIVEYMANGQWLGSVSEREIAKKHDLSPETLRRYSAEANRVLRRRLREDPELNIEARFELLHTFRVIRALGMKDATAGGLGVALNASRALGFYLGIEPARRHEVEHSVDEFGEWTEDELEAYGKDGKLPRRALRFVAQQRLLGEGSGGNGNGHDDTEDEDDDPDAVEDDDDRAH